MVVSIGKFISWAWLVVIIHGFSPRHTSSSSSSSSSSVSSPPSIVELTRAATTTTAYHRERCTVLDANTNYGSESESESGEEGETDPFTEIRRKYLENVRPRLPDRSGGRPPSKSEVYDQTELEKLWDLHKQLSPQTKVKQSTENLLNDANILSIHDLVMAATVRLSSDDCDDDDDDKEEETITNGSTSTNGSVTPSYPWLTKELQERSRNICAIASDVDGTLIGSDQKVHPRTKAAIQKAVHSTRSPTSNLKFFFPATGKTRQGAMNSLGPELAMLIQHCPGVFIQGLYCVYGDTVVFEKKLTRDAVEACEKLVADTGVSVIAYDGDSLYTTDLTPMVLMLHEKYGEPLSQEISSLVEHLDKGGGVHKILVSDADTDNLTTVLRPKLEALAAATNARVTQAMPNILELLPEGCSKALGVQKLCEFLGINPSDQLLALGDAENDVEMLQIASIGVVMGNGSPPARAAGDLVLDETSDEGGAGLAMEILGGLESW